jgi:hypothetical protein
MSSNIIGFFSGSCSKAVSNKAKGIFAICKRTGQIFCLIVYFLRIGKRAIFCLKNDL